VPSILELIRSADPLNDEAAKLVIAYREETTLVDFKLTFTDEDEKWLDTTKDVMAFANTEGGYLAFGVRDKTFDMEGVDAATCVLFEPNQWLQKLNRYVEPHFTGLRCRTIELDGKQFAVVFIPPSLGRTHVVAKDATVKGTTKIVLRQGTFYVRRSGAVHMADARDLDAVVERRFDHMRSTLLDKIAQVVKAPSDTEVLVVKKEGQEGVAQKFVIENAPDAIAVKGMTFSVAPETPEQAVAAWIAMTSANPSDLPSADTVWKWYRGRDAISLTPDQRLRVAAFSLLKGAPFFYWLQGCQADRMKEVLAELLARKPSIEVIENVLGASAFLGKRFFEGQVGRLGRLAERLGKTAVFPDSEPRSNYALNPIGRKGGKADPGDLVAELDQIAKLAAAAPDGPEALKRWRAEKLDCYLYAQDNKYKSEE
jgi:hypothetical protein